MLIADAAQLIQLFQNLLINAIKFRGKQAAHQLYCKATPGHWLFSVEDNGIGMRRNISRNLRDFPATSYDRGIPGTGIGLAICKKIAERHGGRFRVKCIPGEGSTFHFSVPKREMAI